jgi:Restriction Endonuclease associating with ARP
MASRSPGPGELLAGASGFVLLLAMFLPWYGVDSSARLPDGTVVTVSAGDLSAWEAFGVIDIVLAATALLALAVLIVGLITDPPPALQLTAIGAAAVSTLLIVFRLIDAPDLAIDTAPDTAYETGRRLGAFLGLVCTAGIAWGANLAGARAGEAKRAPVRLGGPAPEAPAEATPTMRPPAERPRAPAEPAPAKPRPSVAPAPAAAERPRRERPPAKPAAPAESALAARGLASGPLGGWTRDAIDSECETAWRRYDRRLGARYARYFEEHADLVGDQRTSARDLAAALPPGWDELATAIPADAWGRQHLSGKSSQTLGVGLLGVAARRDPSLAWLWQALDALPPAAAPEPALEFEHVVDPSLLGERPRQTSIDVLVDDPNVLIGVAIKWRERGVGACLCRGEGTGPAAGDHCSRRVEQRSAYWDTAAAVLGLGAREPGDPCPISPAYETVRQAAALRALAGPDRPAVLVMLHDQANPYFAATESWPGWPKLLTEGIDDHESFRFEAISWQELVPLLPLDDETRAWAADKHGLD